MYGTASLQQDIAITQELNPADNAVTAQPLTVEHEAEVLAFLGERPIHTFGMVGFIRSNGLVSPHNRGTFYACRNREGHLEGVALIGHATLFETRCEAATALFARIAQAYAAVSMLFGDKEQVEIFWEHYAKDGQAARLYCSELLFEMRWPAETREAAPGLRLATLDDLDAIVPVHAVTALEESGIDPLEVDPEGFRNRCARRIEQNRTWVWLENQKVMFKAEVVSDAPDITYLEGVWVDPEERSKGYGRRCLLQLSRTLLQHTDSICLLVNANNQGAQEFYKRVGFNFISYYDTIFLMPDVH